MNNTSFDYLASFVNYIPFNPTKENVNKNKGKQVAYLLKRDIDPHRGYYFPRTNSLQERHYSQIIFENQDSIDVRDIIQIKIKID